MVLAGARKGPAPAPTPRAAAAAAVLAAEPPPAPEMDAIEASVLHDRLVAYVHSLGAEQLKRSGVWREHSYARAEGAAGGGGGEQRRDVRKLLAPAVLHGRERALDVGGPGDELCVAVRSSLPCDDADTDSEEETSEGAEGDGHDDWPERVAALAPSAALRRLAATASDVLRAMRLARLAAPPGRARRREQARVAARKLRLALAPLWSVGAGAWLHGAVNAYAPRFTRALLDEALQELALLAPRMSARLPLARRAATADPLAPSAAAAAAAAASATSRGAWLAWVSGASRQDSRWSRRLAPLLPLRPLQCPSPSPAQPPLSPEQWCTSALASLRAQLHNVLADAQVAEVGVVLGGCGAGAALAAALAGSATARGLRGLKGMALLGPPGGGADGADEPLLEPQLPLLLVAGGAGAGRARALDAAQASIGARRVLLVEGADDALRLPARAALRLNLPRHALDAAIAEEVSRWAVEACEAADTDGEAVEQPSPTPTPVAPAALKASPPPAPAPDPAPPRGSGRPSAGLELRVSSSGGASGADTPKSSGRSIEIVEGRVVARSLGGTPLTLPLPRRSAPGAPPARTPHPPAAPPAPALGAADILQLPIVFADDPPPPAATTPSPAAPPPVRQPSRPPRPSPPSSSRPEARPLRYTRVIVAKRGDGSSPSPRPSSATPSPRPASTPSPSPRVSASAGPRPVGVNVVRPAGHAHAHAPRALVVRRALRVLSRGRPSPSPSAHR